MAEASRVSGQTTFDVMGSRRVVSVLLDDPADTNTATFGELPEGIAWAEAHIEDPDAAAADVSTIASVSGNVVTLQVVGTARQTRVVAYGLNGVSR